MKQWVKHHTPPSAHAGGEAIVFTLIAPFYTLIFWYRYYRAYKALFRGVGPGKVLIPGSLMPDFATLIPGLLGGVRLVLIVAIILAIFYYSRFHKGSKSIYLMKRLPKSGELWRRCLSIPLLIVSAALAISFLFLLVYFGLYMLITPAECLQPMQWQTLWADPIGVILCLF